MSGLDWWPDKVLNLKMLGSGKFDYVLLSDI